MPVLRIELPGKRIILFRRSGKPACPNISLIIAHAGWAPTTLWNSPCMNSPRPTLGKPLRLWYAVWHDQIIDLLVGCLQRLCASSMILFIAHAISLFSRFSAGHTLPTPAREDDCCASADEDHSTMKRVVFLTNRLLLSLISRYRVVICSVVRPRRLGRRSPGLCRYGDDR